MSATSTSAPTEITIILDRSGSMSSIREATVQGINDLIKKVQEVPGETQWTLVIFDDPASASGAKEDFPRVVFKAKPDKEMPLLELSEYQPRGSTALVDAVCTVLDSKLKEWLNLPEQQRPMQMVVVMTDGCENASTQYTSEDMRKKIAGLQSEHNWNFTYLGANQDTFTEARKYSMDKTASSLGWLNATVGGALVSSPVYLQSGKLCSSSSSSIASGVISALAPDAMQYMNYEATPRGTYQAIMSGAMGAGAWKMGVVYSGQVQ